MTRPLNVIASEVTNDWLKVNYAARPYLRAMFGLSDIRDPWGADCGNTVVHYFLANAGSWRGPVARRVKAELKAML